MIPLPHHPEPHTYTWTKLELEAISKYAAACVQAETKALRGECDVLVRLLVECDKVLSTLEGENDEEARLLGCLRMSIVHATWPSRPEEADLLSFRAGSAGGEG